LLTRTHRYAQAKSKTQKPLPNNNSHSSFRCYNLDMKIQPRCSALIAPLLFFSGYGCQSSPPTQVAMHDPPPLALPSSLLLTPDAPQMNTPAPALFRVRLETSKGPLVIELHRDWAPIGVDHFYNLVRAGYYDNNKVFRVSRNWVQFGINGDPKISQTWRTRTIPDDPPATPQISNARGTIDYAFAVKDGRTTQLFINLTDNAATHDHPADGLVFIPIGRVIQGMEAADAFNGEYGERALGGIRAGRQDPLFQQGNAYLEKNSPHLDTITKVTILPP
jgi:peptidyl-prolyl cis-trans isomerase A (cyclophilin A)